MSGITKTTAEHPLGLEEGLELEFKRMEALKNPASIAREVASMLNERGGEVWIGFEEEGGRAIREQDIPEPEAARRSLEESLSQRLVPLEEGDVFVRAVVRLSGKHCLLVEVRALTPRTRPPIAALEEGARYFRRVGSRVRPMEWHEIRDRFVDARKNGPQERAIPRGLPLWRKRIETLGTDMFALAIHPSESVSISWADKDVQELLSDPSRAGNRRSGWTYGAAHDGARVDRGFASVGPIGDRELRLSHKGELEFQVRLEYLRARSSDSKAPRLDGLALLEYTVSFFRLAAALYKDRAAMSDFHVDLLLTGAKDWSLPQYPPDSHGFAMGRGRDSPWPDKRLGDYALEQPLPIMRSDLFENPDRIAFRLVRDFYAWCGLPEDRVPRQYDRRTERLVLTD